MRLSKEEKQAIQAGRPITVNIEGAPCVVVRKDIFDQSELDFSPWTPTELDLLVAETAALLDSDGLSEVDSK